MSFAPVHTAGPIAVGNGPQGVLACEGMLERSAGQLKQRTVPSLQPVTFRALEWVVGTVGAEAAITFECHGGKFVRVVLERTALEKCLAALPARPSAAAVKLAPVAPRPHPKHRGGVPALNRAQVLDALRGYCQPGATLAPVAEQYHVSPTTLVGHFQYVAGHDYMLRARAARAAGAEAIETFIASFPQ